MNRRNKAKYTEAREEKRRGEAWRFEKEKQTYLNHGPTTTQTSVTVQTG